MLEYNYTITGKSKLDGKYYKVECFCAGMSKYELEQEIKKQNFEKDSVKIKKEKVKK